MFFLTRAKLRASVNPAAARSCLSSSVSLFSGNCEHINQIHKNIPYLMGYNDIWLQTQTCRRKPRHLVGYGVGAWCGAGDVVETVGHGGVLHDITGVDDVGARWWDLNLDLVTDAGSLGAQAHPGQQLGDSLSWLTVRRKNKRCSSKRLTYQAAEDTLTPSSWEQDRFTWKTN